MSNTVFSLGRVAAVAALALSGSAFAAGQAGMVVVRDANGNMRPATAAEFKVIKDKADKEKASSPQQPDTTMANVNSMSTRQLFANGAEFFPATEDTISYAVVTRNADGSLSDSCIVGTDAANAAVAAPASATTHSKEHKHEIQ